MKDIRSKALGGFIALSLSTRTARIRIRKQASGIDRQ
jgi:hypothetical protein